MLKFLREINTLSIKAITQQEHAQKRFKRYASYQFAATDAIIPLVVRELARASMVLPIAFAKHDNAFVLVAVQGLAAGKNLFVDPDGRWLGRYIPSAYRGYPFALLQAPDDRMVLCFDENSGLLSDNEGEPFFDGDETTQAIKDILNFLTQIASSRQTTEVLCALLDKHQLIQPWPIKLKNDDQDNESEGRSLEGLYRIDEAAFNKLDAESLYEFKQAGALPLIFCQLLSMQHLPALGELSKAHYDAEQQATLPKTEAGEIDMSFLADDTTISFDNL
jgi:hypothetical protein